MSFRCGCGDVTPFTLLNHKWISVCLQMAVYLLCCMPSGSWPWAVHVVPLCLECVPYRWSDTRVIVTLNLHCMC